MAFVITSFLLTSAVVTVSNCRKVDGDGRIYQRKPLGRLGVSDELTTELRKQSQRYA